MKSVWHTAFHQPLFVFTFHTVANTSHSRNSVSKSGKQANITPHLQKANQSFLNPTTAHRPQETGTQYSVCLLTKLSLGFFSHYFWGAQVSSVICSLIAWRIPLAAVWTFWVDFATWSSCAEDERPRQLSNKCIYKVEIHVMSTGWSALLWLFLLSSISSCLQTVCAPKLNQ